MQNLGSMLLEPFNDLQIGSPKSRSRTPTIDKNSDEESSRDPNQGVKNEAIDQGIPKKLTARERLDGLSSLRIHPNAIKYASSKPHGIGGKAEVVKATLKQDDGDEEQEVAVKKLRYDSGIDKRKFANEFVHEVEIVAGLSHQNVIRLIGFVEDLQNGQAWSVLSWEPNGNISEFLAMGEREIPERISLIKDTFDGIQYLHTRQPPICHGDLKSLNILVSSSYRAIISDFGSARTLEEIEGSAIHQDYTQDVSGVSTTDKSTARPRVTIAVAGNQLTLTGPAWSLRWVAPEVAMGERPSLASDIWAAAWVCWEIMTNKVPFPELTAEGAITLKVIQGEVPAVREDTQLSQVISLCSLMTDCWLLDPTGRPSIAECRDQVKRIPSTPPLEGGSSGSNVLSTVLLLQMGKTYFGQASHDKAISLYQQVLSIATSTGDQKTSAHALERLGAVYYARPKFEESKEYYTRAQVIYAGIGDDVGQANALDGLASVCRIQYKYNEAEEYYIKANNLYTRVGSVSGKARTFRGLGHVYSSRSQYAKAKESYTKALDFFTAARSYREWANTLRGIGVLHIKESNYGEARESYAQAYDIYTRIGDDHGRANTLQLLGDVYRLQSKYAEAEESYTQACDVCARIGNDLTRANSLFGLGQVHRKRDQKLVAAAFYREARDLFAQIGRSRDERGASDSLAAVLEGQITPATAYPVSAGQGGPSPNATSGQVVPAGHTSATDQS